MVVQAKKVVKGEQDRVFVGNCGIVEFTLDATTSLTVAPRAVATIVAHPQPAHLEPSKPLNRGVTHHVIPDQIRDPDKNKQFLDSRLRGNDREDSEGGEDERASLTMTVGEGAGVHLILAELPKQGEIMVEVGAGARFTLSVVGELKWQRTLSSLIRLTGEGANAHVQVAVVGRGESEAEFTCTIEHAARQTFARMLVRRVQQDNSFSTLKGMLKVGVGAHGTDTYLSDKALLLGERARAESQPGLEILADDVKASHGATVGQLSPDELFYLRSRGIGEAQAKELLVQAFWEPALVGVPLELKNLFLT